MLRLKNNMENHQNFINEGEQGFAVVTESNIFIYNSNCSFKKALAKMRNNERYIIINLATKNSSDFIKR